MSVDFGNVLITSAGSKSPLISAMQAAIQSIGAGGKTIAGDSSSKTIAEYVADDFWHMPPSEDAHLDEILEGCLKKNIKAVLPTRDDELFFWKSHDQIFREADIQVILSPLDTLHKCLDKHEFSKLAAEHGLPIIESHLVLESCVSDKIVVKERFGSGSRNIQLGVSRAEANEFSRQLVEPIFQDFVSGAEISADIWASKNQELVLTSIRTRDVVVDGEAKVTRTLKAPDVANTLTELAKILKLEGPAVIQALVSGKNLNVIECNPRFGGASTASIAAGLPILELTLLETWGQSIESTVSKVTMRELTQVRINKDIYF